MRKITTYLCVGALLAQTACGPNGGKAAGAAADTSPVLVNRVEETIVNGETVLEGKIAIVDGVTSQAQLEAKIDSGDIEFVGAADAASNANLMAELDAAGFTLENKSVPEPVEGQQVAPLAAFLVGGLIFGLIGYNRGRIDQATYNRAACHSCGYHSVAVAAPTYVPYRTTYYRPVHHVSYTAHCGCNYW